MDRLRMWAGKRSLEKAHRENSDFAQNAYLDRKGRRTHLYGFLTLAGGLISSAVFNVPFEVMKSIGLPESITSNADLAGVVLSFAAFLFLARRGNRLINESGLRPHTPYDKPGGSLGGLSSDPFENPY